MIENKLLAANLPLEYIYKPADTLGGGNATLSSLLNPIIANILVISGIVAFVTILLSGFSYITAGGDKNKIAQSQNMLNYSILGLVVIAAAFIITRIIGAVIGVESGAWI